MKPRNADLLALVGKKVEVITTENETYTGVLRYTKVESPLKRKPNYFTIGNLDFKVSHIKSVRGI